MPRIPPVHLAGEEVSGRHVCLLHRGSEELFAQVGPFMVEGLEAGDHAFHLGEDRVIHRERLDD